MKNFSRSIIFALAAILILSCSENEKRIIATVNGKPITTNDFINELKLFHLSDTSIKNPSNTEKYYEFKKEVLNSMIKEKIFMEEAKAMEIEVSDREVDDAMKDIQKDYPGDSFVKYLRDKGINFNFWKDKIRSFLITRRLTDAVTSGTQNVGDNEIQEYYEKNKSSFSVTEEIHAYQIIVKTEEEAYKILKELNTGKKFEELAKTYSTGPESKNGGDMGYFGRGSMPPAFDNILFKLPQGRISKVVASEYGHHIFKVTDKKPARIKPLEEVRREITNELLRAKMDGAFSQWLKDKIAKAKIKRNNGLLANIK